MLNRNIFKTVTITKIITKTIFTVSAFMISTNLNAQTFNNTGGTYEAAESCGIIKMKGTDAAHGNADGNFIAIGTTPTTRIGGTVVWSKNGNQKVQNGLYFTNVKVYSNVPGSIKTFDTAYVSRDFDYFQGDNGTFIEHLCSGIIVYDGTAYSQKVLKTANFSGGEINNYYHKIYASGDPVLVADYVKTSVFGIGAGSALHITTGELDIEHKSICPNRDTSNITDSLIVDCTGKIKIGNGMTVNVSGNGAIKTECDNIITDTTKPCADNTCEPGRWIYHCGTKIWTNSQNTPYGILELNCDDCSHTFDLTGNIYISGHTDDALKLRQGKINTHNYKIIFNDSIANIKYDSCCAEIIGWIQRTANGTTIGKDYTLHNTGTHIALSALPQSFFALQVLPNTKPSKANVEAGYGYMNRQVEIDYDGNTGKISKLEIGFLKNEIILGSNSPSDTNVFINKLRGFEAIGSGSEMYLFAGNNADSPAPWENSTTLCGLFQKTQNKPINLDNKKPGTADAYFYDIDRNSQIVFVDEPIWFVSIRNGRWSDPGTWNMGATPTSTDNVMLRHIVYTGFSDNTNQNIFGQRQYNQATATSMTSENLLPGTTSPDSKTGQINTLADTLRIVVHPTDVSSKGALVIGNNATNESNGSTAIASMNIGIPLRFNYIDNKVDGNNTPLTSGNELTIAKGSIDAFGVLITACGVAPVGPILNGVTIFNGGKFTNRSTLTVGVGDND